MSNKRFGMELKRIFGKPVSKRINGFPVKVYEVVKLDFNHPTTHESRANTKDDDDIPF
jgi:hypothetical protein